MSPKGIYNRSPRTEEQSTGAQEPEQVVEEKTQQAHEPSQPEAVVIKTELDAYISSRLQSQPKTIEEIQVAGDIDNTDATNILKLPKPIQTALEKKGLVPRWLNKDKRAIDRALDVRRWVIVNRAIFPNLPRHFFTANGTIENGDLILACMSASRAEKLRSIPGERSSEKMKDLPMNRWKQSSGSEKVGFYKPAYTAERDGETIKEPGLVVTPDLPDKTE